MRGEYPLSAVTPNPALELPPRARRILIGLETLKIRIGTTSACAENTLKILTDLGVNRNYLRVRGEYGTGAAMSSIRWELPPRARRILFSAASSFFVLGTTSACAENTVHGDSDAAYFRNYLRVRGEYATILAAVEPHLELPPRARRILSGNHQPVFSGGTTSACAENTPMCHPKGLPAGNYLRVRGEYRQCLVASNPVSELPPRARRIP